MAAPAPRIVPALLDLAGRAASRLPRGVLLPAGTLLGLFWNRVVPVRIRLAREHARAALGADAPGARRIVRQACIETARNLLEMLAWRRLARAGGRVPWVERTGTEHLDAARAGGRGVVLLTGHLGNFDLCAVHEALGGLPVHIVSKRLSARGLDTWWQGTRGTCGVRILPEEGTFRAAREALRLGGAVGLVLDQHSREERAVEAPFLGIPARTSPALATLALRAGAPIVPCLIRRRPDGGHRIAYLSPVPLAGDGTGRQRIEETTRRCLAVLERAVREEPGQWFWFHRRWKDARGRALVGPGGRAG